MVVQQWTDSTQAHDAGGVGNGRPPPFAGGGDDVAARRAPSDQALTAQMNRKKSQSPRATANVGPHVSKRSRGFSLLPSRDFETKTKKPSPPRREAAAAEEEDEDGDRFGFYILADSPYLPSAAGIGGGALAAGEFSDSE
uniref:Uncharacterized protein n=1 Tax=Leersia perrieri TaxID=77586 RepID=A0A0D9WCW9_9ORYZ